jgi:RecB family endonuclease NucS
MGLKLYIDEKGKKGIEYPAQGRFIDILALDGNNNFVVLELKKSKGHEEVVGQISRYITWVQENLAKAEQKVRGLIICQKITEDLRLACKITDKIELFEYTVSTQFNKK